MTHLQNPYHLSGLNHPDLAQVPAASCNPSIAQDLLKRCPEAGQTPLHDRPDMAAALSLGAVYVKDEAQRMGLGSFKALGAAYVIAYNACIDGQDQTGKTYATASAGNHGLSVAAGARAFGANAVIYIAHTVPEAFAERLRAQGAQVMRAGTNYEESIATAKADAEKNGWILLSDTSWAGYSDMPFRLMEGYTVMMAEAAAQIPQPPTHVMLQAGVGGLAAACAAMARHLWGTAPHITVVEPEFAPALMASILAGAPVVAQGPVSAMGRLDCKEPSLIALKGLAHDANDFVTITEDEGAKASEFTAQHGLHSTPSGTAGFGAAMVHKDKIGLDKNARVLFILSEGPE